MNTCKVCEIFETEEVSIAWKHAGNAWEPQNQLEMVKTVVREIRLKNRRSSEIFVKLAFLQREFKCLKSDCRFSLNLTKVCYIIPFSKQLLSNCSLQWDLWATDPLNVMRIIISEMRNKMVQILLKLNGAFGVSWSNLSRRSSSYCNFKKNSYTIWIEEISKWQANIRDDGD